jgi:hypothetical protein
MANNSLRERPDNVSCFSSDPYPENVSVSDIEGCLQYTNEWTTGQGES